MNIIGPSISIDNLKLDFGLMRVNSKKSLSLNIINESEINAEVIVKLASDKGIKWDTIELFKDDASINTTHSSRLYEKNELPYIIDENYGKLSPDLDIKPSFYAVVPSNSMYEFEVVLNSQDEEMIDTYLEISEKNSPPQYISIKAVIQQASVNLNTSSIIRDTI
jgi:hypothetical protein